jgi:hypothetical protein
VKKTNWATPWVPGYALVLCGRPTPGQADYFTVPGRWDGSDWIATRRLGTHRRLQRAHDWNLTFTPSQNGGVTLTFNMIAV